MTKKQAVIPHERIEGQIYLLRGQKVMLSMDLAELYGVEVRALTQAVKRNTERFPEDFMFQLTREEASILKSQSVILKEPVKPRLRSQSVILKRGQHIKNICHTHLPSRARRCYPASCTASARCK